MFKIASTEDMKFDLARQPIVPAFFTLFILAWVAVGITPSLPSVEMGADLGVSGGSPSPLRLLMPSTMVDAFSMAHPSWSAFLTLLAFLFSGVTLGRQAIRYNLYTVGTCISVPLYLFIILCVGVEALSLKSIFGTMLFAFAMKNFYRMFRTGDTFDANFRAAFYLSAMLMLMPKSLPVALLLPYALFLFHRTLREAVVTLAGLCFFPFVWCYLNWMMGGEFLAPCLELWSGWSQGAFFDTFSLLNPLQFVGLGVVLLLDLMSVYLFLSDIYGVGTKPRYLLLFTIGAFLLSLSVVFMPSFGVEDLLLLAVPSAMLMPCLFIRVSRLVSTTLYLQLLVVAIVRLAF